jgi:hypothetical protein
VDDPDEDDPDPDDEAAGSFEPLDPDVELSPPEPDPAPPAPDVLPSLARLGPLRGGP